MNKLSQILIFSILVMGIIACHNNITAKDKNSNLKQVINASMKVDTECIDESKKGFVACVEVYAPVCGCDGRTYGNVCHARREGVRSWKEGTCRQLSKAAQENRYIIRLDSTAFPEITSFEQNIPVNERPNPAENRAYESFAQQQLVQFAQQELGLEEDWMEQFYTGPVLGFAIVIPTDQKEALLARIKDAKEVESVEKDRPMNMQ